MDKLGKLMGDSFTVLKNEFRVLWPLMLILVLIPQGVLAVAQAVAPIEEVSFSNPYHLAFIIWQFLSIFASILFSLVLAYTLVKKDKKTPESVFRNSLAYLGAYIVLVIIMVALLIPAFILFIIPGVILSIYWTFSSLILVDQNRKPWESMMRSTAMVKGKWWKVFGYVLLLMLLSFVALLGVIFLLSVPMVLGELAGGAVEVIANSFFSVVLLAVYSVVVLYFNIFISRMYFSLKNEKLPKKKLSK